MGREKVASQVKEFQEMREAFENKCFDKDKVIDAPFHSVSWELSDYGKHVNVACTILQTRDIELSTVIHQMQHSQVYKVPIKRGSLLQDMVSRIQRDYNDEYPS